MKKMLILIFAPIALLLVVFFARGQRNYGMDTILWIVLSSLALSLVIRVITKRTGSAGSR